MVQAEITDMHYCSGNFYKPYLKDEVKGLFKFLGSHILDNHTPK